MRKIITGLIFTLILSFSIFAQDKEEKEEVECPIISVTGPATSVKPGEMQTFTVTISGGNVDTKKNKIKWSVDKGTIIKGQGTTSILVKGTDDDETLTATVNVDSGGDCKAIAHESSIICYGSVQPYLIDEFGKIASGDIKARIDAYLVELENNPNAKGFIINYGSKRDILKRENLIRNYMSMRRYDVNRITYVNGSVEKQIRTRLWVAPQGADESKIN